MMGIHLSEIMGQNYPNPFSNKTTIPYRLNKATHVKLSIFSFPGQKVASLVDEKQSAGHYTVEWSGTDYSGNPLLEGIYLCSLVTDNHPAQYKKIIKTN
jgi:flagellar hook assembly protein FlgD